MISKLMAVVGLSVVGVFAVPGAASAYTAPVEADLRLLIEPDAIRLGDTAVPFRSQALMPLTEATFTITPPRTTRDHVPLTVTESADGAGELARGIVDTTTTKKGQYAVEAVLPEVGVYTITSEGTDLNGDVSMLTMQFKVGALAESEPITFLGYVPLIAGSTLAVAGASFFFLARRRHGEADEVVPAQVA